jgi:hypothetical protein
MTEFCGLCRYWEFDHRPFGRNALGECHRHAPVPGQQVMSLIAQLLGHVAFNTAAAANLDSKDAEELFHETELHSSFQVHEWPITESSEWCGDFALRAGPAPLDSSRPLSTERAAAADQWEASVGLNDTGP